VLHPGVLSSGLPDASGPPSIPRAKVQYIQYGTYLSLTWQSQNTGIGHGPKPFSFLHDLPRQPSLFLSSISFKFPIYTGRLVAFVCGCLVERGVGCCFFVAQNSSNTTTPRTCHPTTHLKAHKLTSSSGLGVCAASIARSPPVYIPKTSHVQLPAAGKTSHYPPTACMLDHEFWLHLLPHRAL
jgi:hypothetical protein